MVGPIEVDSTLVGHFAAITTKLSGTQSILSQSLYPLKEFATISFACIFLQWSLSLVFV